MRAWCTALWVGLPLGLGACGPGTTGPGGGGFCGALSGAAMRCATSCPSTCDQTLVNDCAKLSTALSPTYLQALATCLASTCNSAGTSSSIASCLTASASGITPTDAQKALAIHFCAKCAGGAGSSCADAFFSTSSITSVGALLAPVSDSVALAVDTMCTNLSFCTPPTFANCATPVILAGLGRVLPSATAMCLVDQLSAGYLQTCNLGNADMSVSGNPDLAMPMSIPDLARPRDLTLPMSMADLATPPPDLATANMCSTFDSSCTMFGSSCTNGMCTNVGCCCPAPRICGSGSFPYCCPAGQTCMSTSMGPACL